MTEQPTRDQLRALANQAARGPWTVDDGGGYDFSVTQGADGDYIASDVTPRDAAFIAAARTAIPQLLDQLDQAEADSEKRGELVARALAVSETWRKRAVRAEAQSGTRRLQAEYWQERARNLAQEVRDERAACLDQIEQVHVRDALIDQMTASEKFFSRLTEAEARIKAVRDVLAHHPYGGPDQEDAIRRALNGYTET